MLTTPRTVRVRVRVRVRARVRVRVGARVSGLGPTQRVVETGFEERSNSLPILHRE